MLDRRTRKLTHSSAHPFRRAKQPEEEDQEGSHASYTDIHGWYGDLGLDNRLGAIVQAAEVLEEVGCLSVDVVLLTPSCASERL
jgi:hypothetical protein